MRKRRRFSRRGAEHAKSAEGTGGVDWLACGDPDRKPASAGAHATTRNKIQTDEVRRAMPATRIGVPGTIATDFSALFAPSAPLR